MNCPFSPNQAKACPKSEDECMLFTNTVGKCDIKSIAEDLRVIRHDIREIEGFVRSAGVVVR